MYCTEAYVPNLLTENMLEVISFNKMNRWQLRGIDTVKACIFSIFQWFSVVKINTNNETITITWSYIGVTHVTRKRWTFLIWHQRPKRSQVDMGILDVFWNITLVMQCCW